MKGTFTGFITDEPEEEEYEKWWVKPLIMVIALLCIGLYLMLGGSHVDTGA